MARFSQPIHAIGACDTVAAPRKPRAFAMTSTPLTYAAAGVDYKRVDALKLLAQRAAASTSKNAESNGMIELGESRGESAYVAEVNGLLIASITECLGTK